MQAQLGRGKDSWEETLLFDLSAGGAGIHTRSPLPLQSEVRLRFRLPAGGVGAEVEVTALVVRTGPPARAAQGYSHVSGLHFLDLHGESFDKVRAHVWQLLDQESG